MKLLNQSIQYLSISILAIVSIWSVLFYLNMLDEIYDSIDDGLDNYKMLIIQKSARDSNILGKTTFDESNYAIRSINKQQALKIKDGHKDTLLYMPYEKDLEPVRMLTTAFEQNGRYYELKIISSMAEEDDLIEDLFWSVLWLYLILIVSIVVINNVVLQKLWKPFYRILQQLKSFRLDKTVHQAHISTGTDEFIELKKAADTLMDHVAEAYANQKQFTENAAHELQTPLAIATGKLEILLEKGDLSETDAESITQVLQVMGRLARLNGSLLLLSRIENKQYPDSGPVSINKTVRACVEDSEEFAAFKNVGIAITESGSLEYTMDAALADILVSNLIRNAILHNVPNGQVTILITEKVLQITNTARGNALDADKIFNRFYKDSSAQNNTGLGLAIARAICRLYGLKISYLFTTQHCFEVAFPGE